MTPERWQQIRAVFDSAVEQPAAGADEFLRRTCGEDSDLYSEVRRMLQEHQKSGLLDHTPLGVATAPAGSPPVFQPGQIVSARYRIVRYLSRGGMGEVYEAQDLELAGPVALKTLLPSIADDEAMIARFKQEIALSRRIAHPNVCKVFDLDRHEAAGQRPVVYLSMEFLDGETLAAKLRREGPMGTAESLSILRQVGEALDAAHQAGVIHRDLKPSNVMLVASADGIRAVVTDFGLARSFVNASGSTASMSNMLVGTLDYMAPELLTGSVATFSSDVYALGMVAYRMVAGALPFAADTPLAGAIMRSNQPVPSPRTLIPALDERWEHAILRAVDADPNRRFNRARHFLQALSGEAVSMTVRLPVMTRRRTLAAVLAVLVGIGGAIGWREWDKARSRPPAEALALYRKGVEDIQAGAYFAATKALGRSVLLSPRFTVAHARLAEAWIGLEMPEAAGREIQFARRQDNSSLSKSDQLLVEALDFTITREFPAAVGKYEELIAIASPRATDLYVDLGRAYENAGQRDNAIQAYRQAAEGPSHNPEAWLRLAVLYARSSEAGKSQAAFHEAESSFQLTSNLEGLTEVAQQHGVAENDKEELEQASVHLHSALETARLANNVQQEIRAKLNLSTNAYLAGDTSTAERYAIEALDTARVNQMESLAVRGLISLGSAYLRKDDADGAVRYYQEALSLARRSGSINLVARCLLLLASLHDSRRQFDQAAAEAKEALAFYQSNRFAQETFSALTIIGRSYRNRGDYAAAQEASSRLLDLAQKAQDRSQISRAYEALGGLFFGQEKYPDALEQYQKESQLTGSEERTGWARIQCGNTLWILGRYSEAADDMARVAPVAEKFPALNIELARNRAEIELSQNQFAAAAKRAKEALRLDKSQKAPASAEFKRILGLALLGSANKSAGLQNCQNALDAAANLDVRALLRARIALIQALLDNNNPAGALAVFRTLEPTLSDYPESRWRARALAARANRQYVVAARQAFEDLGRIWGKQAIQDYSKRPDIQLILGSLSQLATNR